MNIIDRIQTIISNEGLTVSSFARKIGVNDQTIRGIVVQRRNKPGYDLILKIIQTFDWLSSEWLLTGQGEMKKDSPAPVAISENQEVENLLEIIRQKDNRIEELIEERTLYKIKLGLISKD
ncbi:MAG: hypothetical protein PHR45_03180 [Muribaculaceae bacterium]|nr:hypothetical protein [Muribaculaceae bacterium]